MAVITSYATLQTAIADYLTRDDLTTWLPNFTQNFEEDFYRDPKNYGPWMETALSVAINTTAAVPADYLALKVAYISGRTDKALTPATLEQLYTAYPRAGGASIPKWFARNGANFEFGPVATGGLTLVGTYYAKPALLRNASTNYLTTNAPDLLLYGSLLGGELFIKNDSRWTLWQALYDKALDSYRKLQKAGNLSGGALQVLVA